VAAAGHQFGANTMVDNFLAQLRTAIEKRVREQLARRLQVDPNADLPKIIVIQIGQERERLESQALEYEDAGRYKQAELVRMLIDDWLPELAQQLRQR
jgi:hypothetical protein